MNNSVIDDTDYKDGITSLYNETIEQYNTNRTNSTNSSGIAAKAELGRYPIILYLVNQALKFYTKIALDEDKLVYKALQSEIQLHRNSEHSRIKAMEYFASKAGNASSQVTWQISLL